MNGIYLYFVTNTFLVGRNWDFKEPTLTALHELVV